ncbi:MAG: serine hydrolase [Armatimonadetes bacterium]|nr:serine hydrolase [Armatimonadota bacterium]
MPNGRFKRIGTAAATVAVWLFAPLALGQQTPVSLKQRLEHLVEQLEQRREQYHIPGLAIAVVKGDKIILARGLGLADVENKKPVTPETIFAIGSSTKAFTAAIIGMLVDEGKMTWDDPVTKYVPYFDLDIDTEDEDAVVTIRDLLSHRTGFTRMGILWMNGRVPRDEILRTAAGAEPFAPLRTRFLYSNVMFLAAGASAERAADSDWETLIAERIFEPLGMTSSNTSVPISQKDERLSLGYMWDEDKEEQSLMPMRVLTNIAPAGAINSNVMDMAQWVRFQLRRGEHDGQRLLSEEQHKETWTTQTNIAGGVSYGLGWMLREWKGQPVIEHGGNIDGFSAQVGLLPESDIGFVLLTNVTLSPLQGESTNLVWEAIVGDWDEPAGDAKKYEEYLGKYIANFGPFKDARLTVLVQNGRLAVDVPGQMVYELKVPDEDGKWYFALTDTVAVAFERNDAGDVNMMRMHQSGLAFELAREGAVFDVEIPLDELQKYFGNYRSEELNKTVKVLIQNNRLAVDWPGEMVYGLRPPNAEGVWVFRVTDRLTLTFQEATNGAIESLTFFGADKEYPMPRVQADEGPALPTGDEVMAQLKMDERKAALDAIGTFRFTGTVRIAQSGLHGKFTVHASGTDRYRQDLDFGKFGKIQDALNGDRGWNQVPGRPREELDGNRLELARQGHPAAWFADWREFFDSIRVVRADELDGREVYVLELKSGYAPATTIFVDAETGDVLRADTTAQPLPGVNIPVTTRYEDFREVHGLRIPFRTILSNDWSGRTIIQIEKIDVNLKVSGRIFNLRGSGPKSLPLPLRIHPQSGWSGAFGRMD